MNLLKEYLDITSEEHDNVGDQPVEGAADGSCWHLKEIESLENKIKDLKVPIKRSGIVTL